MKKYIVQLLMLLSTVLLQARNIVVIAQVEDSDAPASGMTMFAMTQQGSRISDAEETDIDGTYIIQGVPEQQYIVVYGVNGVMGSYFVETPMDTLRLTVHPKYVPRRVGEVEVSADNQYMTANKSVYVPTKGEKKVARGGGSLVQAMGIAALSVDPMSGSISMLSGQSVAKFIDYVPATEQDIANIRPMDVKRVELLEYPSDPRFRGAEYVLNFIMVKYEYGGYTKLDADQNVIVDYGSYSINSKLMSGKVTYDAAANFNYKRSTHDGSTQKSIYKFPDLEIVRNKQIQSSDVASRSGFGSFRATYASDKALITNTIGFNVSKRPYEYFDYATDFSPLGVFANGIDRQYHSTSSVSPSWQGSYLWYLPKKYSITVDPAFSYGHHTTDRIYQAQNEDITSFANDKNLRYKLAITAQKQIGKHSMSLRSAVSGIWDEISYQGSSMSNSRLNEFGFNINARLFSVFGQGWTTATVVFNYQRTSFNHFCKTQTYPTILLGGGYTLRNKHKFNLTAQMTRWIIPVSQQMPSFVLTSQIDAMQGNEALTPVLNVPVNFNYQWLMSKVVSLSLFADYNYSKKPITSIYVAENYNGRPLMVKTLENSGFYNSVSYGAAVNLRLLKNTLMLRGYVGGKTANRHEGINRSGTYVNYNFGADYRIKNFYCNLVYGSGLESVELSSYTKTPAYYYMGFGWSNGNLNVSAYLVNPFTSDWKHTYYENGDNNFINSSQSYGISYHRHVSLRLSYSFSYGKKVKQTQSIGSISGSESGIL